MTSTQETSNVELVRDLIKRAFGKKLKGKDNIVFRIKLFAEILDGDQKAAWMLNQVIYWSDRTTNPEGWFWKTYADWHNEIGLTEREIRRILKGDKRRQKPRKTLQDIGVEIDVFRAPNGSPTMHYRVNQAIFFAVLVEHLENHYGLSLDSTTSDEDSSADVPCGENTTGEVVAAANHDTTNDRVADGQDGNCTVVNMETDHCASETAALPNKDTKITKYRPLIKSHPHPPPDETDLFFQQWEKELGEQKDSLKQELREQVQRLGQDQTREVVLRCIRSGARTWFYVLKSLKNETAPTMSAHNAYPPEAFYDDDDEEPYEEFRARIEAEEIARIEAAYPECIPTARVNLPWTDGQDGQTIQDAWDAISTRLKKHFGVAGYNHMFSGARLVDFQPETETLIVTIKFFRVHNEEARLRYDTAGHIARMIYGAGKDLPRNRGNVRFVLLHSWAYEVRNRKQVKHA